MTLGNNEGVTVLELDPVEAVFPLSLSFNFCVVTPLLLAHDLLSPPSDGTIVFYYYLLTIVSDWF